MAYDTGAGNLLRAAADVQLRREKQGEDFYRVRRAADAEDARAAREFRLQAWDRGETARDKRLERRLRRERERRDRADWQQDRRRRAVQDYFAPWKALEELNFVSAGHREDLRRRRLANRAEEEELDRRRALWNLAGFGPTRL